MEVVAANREILIVDVVLQQTSNREGAVPAFTEFQTVSPAAETSALSFRHGRAAQASSSA